MRKFNNKTYPNSWEIFLAGQPYQEIAKVDLVSKYCIWTCKEPAKWGTHKIVSFENTDSKALINGDNKIVAVVLGNGKLSKLCVNSELHWEQRGTTKLGPGLDWLNKKNWDFRSRENELWEIILSGQVPKNKRMMVEEDLD